MLCSFPLCALKHQSEKLFLELCSVCKYSFDIQIHLLPPHTGRSCYKERSRHDTEAVKRSNETTGCKTMKIFIDRERRERTGNFLPLNPIS